MKKNCRNIEYFEPLLITHFGHSNTVHRPSTSSRYFPKPPSSGKLNIDAGVVAATKLLYGRRILPHSISILAEPASLQERLNLMNMRPGTRGSSLAYPPDLLDADRLLRDG